MGASIFISYRREDSAATCGRIYDRLVARFGRDAVFKDVDSIPPGVDFRAHIGAIMERCAVQLVVIGPHWLDATDAQGRRRLEQPADLVRLEVEAALQRGMTVIPLLVQGAGMPAEEGLPASLRALAYRNALPVRYDPDFDTDMARVVGAVERVAPAPAPAAAPPSVPIGASAAQAWNATNDLEYRRTRPPFWNVPDRFIRTVAIAQHRIDVQARTNWTNQQRVFYDGAEVATGTKATRFGHKIYTFAVTEEGARVVYEVAVSIQASVLVRRDGQEIYRD